MREKKSVIKEILKYLVILIALLITVLVAFLISSYEILKKEIVTSSDSFLRIYSNEINNNLNGMNKMLLDIVSQQEDLFKLKSTDENERTISSQSLCIYMQDLLDRNNCADLAVIYDNEYGKCLDVKRDDVNYVEKDLVREFTKKLVYTPKNKDNEWNFININNNFYMYKSFVSNGRVIAIYLRTSRLLNTLLTQEETNRRIVLADDSGKIGRLWGKSTQDIVVGANINDIETTNFYVAQKSIAGNKLQILCYTGKNAVFEQIEAGTIIVIITVSVAVIFMLFILRFTQNKIAQPMKRIVRGMEKIKGGEYNNHIDGDFETQEFQLLKDTTNRMVDDIVGLKIQTYEKKIELQDMELRSIRLQLKPHFFLNALTTISSLSSQSKNDDIVQFIYALSKNVRYMFSAGFHTVTVKEEVKHVENYIEMQELKYPGCVFHLIDLPPELEDWQIPQMLIHTYIENVYKYAVSLDNLLTVLIKISKQTYKGEEMLLVEIEDDGKGYPQEVLNYMSEGGEKSGEKGVRIGLWSIKRMMELMYDRNDLVYLENKKPHGCMNRIYVPVDAKHQLK